MSSRQFLGLSGPVGSPELSQDYEKAQRFGKLRVGALGVYFRDGLRLRHVAYGEMARVVLRIEKIQSRTCCSGVAYPVCHMIFVVGNQEIDRCLSEDRAAMEAAVRAIRAQAPALAVDAPAGV